MSEELDPDAGAGAGAKRARADRIRDRRDYDETYGRGGGDRFETAGQPRSYGPSGSMDWRRALRAYVTGHDRGWEADRKYREAEARVADFGSPAAARREERPERSREPEAEGRPADATARAARALRFGVPVARTLRFHRGASTWRDRLPFAPD